MPEWLTKNNNFPPVSKASSEGIVALGGDLSHQRLLLAYRQGVYPCYSPGQPIIWWSPDPRGIIPLDGLYIGKTLGKVLKRNPYEIRINTAFEDVMLGCAFRHDESDARWITEEMLLAYTNLHILGYAHSVEVWDGVELVGGLYGIAIGGLFAGESMFYRASNASKLALVALVGHLKSRGFTLLDCQMVTEATGKMGAIEIRRSEYLQYLQKALLHNCTF